MRINRFRSSGGGRFLAATALVAAAAVAGIVVAVTTRGPSVTTSAAPLQAIPVDSLAVVDLGDVTASQTIYSAPEGVANARRLPVFEVNPIGVGTQYTAADASQLIMQDAGGLAETLDAAIDGGLAGVRTADASRGIVTDLVYASTQEGPEVAEGPESVADRPVVIVVLRDVVWNGFPTGPASPSRGDRSTAVGKLASDVIVLFDANDGHFIELRTVIHSV